jgi:hypothetical protein
MRRYLIAVLLLAVTSLAVAHNGSIHTHDLVALDALTMNVETLVQTDVPANPVSTRLEGLRTFDIGPDWPDTFDTVPWGDLHPGDVVNIHWRSDGYVAKVGIQGRGTATSPIVINGVTNSLGQRPMISFAGAKTSAGSANVFSGDPQWGETLGGFVIKRVNGDWNGPKPSHIHIQNLDLRNGRGQYTTLAGETRSFSSAGCVYVLVGADIVLDNMVITNCGFGIFTLAKEGEIAHTTERLVVRNSRIYDNCTVNSWFDHNVYSQGVEPLFEGNYIGKCIDGALGSSFKDRSARLIFRNNYVVSSDRALDLVHVEDADETAALPVYGFDYVYGNTIINNSAYESVHFGGDNWCEDEDESEPCTPPVEYRSQLFFWGNHMVHRNEYWRTILFGLSLKTTVAHVWGNTFDLGPESPNYYALEYAGDLRLGPDNVVVGSFEHTGRDGLLNSNINVTTGNPIPDDEFLQTLLD